MNWTAAEPLPFQEDDQPVAEDDDHYKSMSAMDEYLLLRWRNTL